jgi:hypothetical protein
MPEVIPRMKFAEFVDLLLMRLYEADQKAGSTPVDLNALVQDLKDPVPEDWTRDAAKILNSRGLADCMFTFGAVHGSLTGMGRLFVEEDRGTGIIPQYKESPDRFVRVTVLGNNHNVNVNVGGNAASVTQSQMIERERQPVFQLVDEAATRLKSDGTLTEDERKELLSDIEALRGQLKRREPNRPAIAAILTPLSKITSIATQIASLIKLLNN